MSRTEQPKTVIATYAVARSVVYQLLALGFAAVCALGPFWVFGDLETFMAESRWAPAWMAVTPIILVLCLPLLGFLVMLFTHGGEALYVRGGRLVCVHPGWWPASLAEVKAVEVEWQDSWLLARVPNLMLRMRSGHRRQLTANLFREPAEEIARRIEVHLPQD